MRYNILLLGILSVLAILAFDMADCTPIKYREFFPRGFHMGEFRQHKPVYLVNREGKITETLQRASRDATLLRSERNEEESTKIPMETSSTMEKKEAIASRSAGANIFSSRTVTDMYMEDKEGPKSLIRREDELQLNQIFQEMHKAKGQVELAEEELTKSEKIAEGVLKLFWEAINKVQEIASVHVAASDFAAKLANDTMNAQYVVQQRDAVLSQARQMYNSLNQKYLVLQVELLKKASACSNQTPPGMSDGAQNRPQSQGPNPPPTSAGAGMSDGGQNRSQSQGPNPPPTSAGAMASLTSPGAMPSLTSAGAGMSDGGQNQPQSQCLNPPPLSAGAGMSDGSQNQPQIQGPSPPPTSAGAPPHPSSSNSASASTPAPAGRVAKNPGVAVNGQRKTNLLLMPMQRLVPNMHPQVMN